jgi:hypothetical protein
MNFRFSSDSHILSPAESVEEFLLPAEQAKHFSSVQYNTKYFIDFDSKYIYIKLPLGITDEYPDGHLDLSITAPNGQEIYRETMPLLIHHVWNFFDEFGLLLDTPRLYGEKNAPYKERILDVFRRPAGSHYQGLINGIARELGLIHEVQWHDGRKDITLYHNRIDIDSILVDGDTPEAIGKDEHGRIVLYGNPDNAGITQTVRFIVGVEVHEIHDNEDRSFQDTLYNLDGTATKLLKHYTTTIHNHVPIFWGQWKWNEGFWNTSDNDMIGYGYVPVLYDASFSGWNHYVPKEGKA